MKQLKRKIINIFGSSGSGSTTLAKIIAKQFDYILIDTDDALWEDTDPPFTKKKSPEESLKYITDRLKTKKSVVISGSLIGFGDKLKSRIDLFVYLNLELDIRLKRIQKREKNRFGERVLPGGDLYVQHQDFLKWVSDYENNPEYMRSRKQHLQWIKDIDKPVIRITEELSIEELLKIVKPFINNN